MGPARLRRGSDATLLGVSCWAGQRACLYHTLAPVYPTRTPEPAGMTAAARFRPSYRYVATVLHAMGREIDQELSGSERPDLVEEFLAGHRAWLA